MKQTIKRVFMGALLAASVLAHAQSLPKPTQINVPIACWGLDDGRKVLENALKGPFKPFLEAREGEGSDITKLLLLVDSSDGELFMFRIVPDAAVCLLSHGFVEKLGSKVFKGI